MKLLATVALAALWAQQATAHATFQQLWVDGVDYGSQCARIPTSNSPVTDVSSSAIRCNAGSSRPSVKCPVKAGGTVTVEMHQQPSTRTCTTEAIGGAHHGPVLIYLSRVPDATTADGSTGWFKIFQDSWAKTAPPPQAATPTTGAPKTSTPAAAGWTFESRGTLRRGLLAAC
ncbi:hypothetical protein N0V88_001591 [Collariella sp. IMI 366227]|nr:hypothetical protein N0V88_001591 [Collariella sp. IMI 366227]